MQSVQPRFRPSPIPLLILLATVLLPDRSHADPGDPSTDRTIITNFVGQYCIECHDADTSEGDREFDSFQLPLENESQLITADEIIDQVTLRQMPPENSDQPTDAERIELINALRNGITNSRARFKSTGSRTVMRRLSNREYENTLAVLFDRRVDTLGLTLDFPKENTSHHLDNIGESLVTSGFLLDQYFHAASRLVEARLGKPAIDPQTWHFKNNFRQYEELHGSHRSVFNFEYLCLYEQPNTDTRQGGYGHIEDFLEGVPVSGLYDIEVHAQAMHRDTHYDPDIFRIDLSEPFQIGVVPGDASKGHIHYPQSIEPILATAVVPDEEPEWLKFRVWLEHGQTPRFIFPNGPYESRAIVMTLNERYKDEFEKPEMGVGRASLLREGKLPHIRIGEIKVHGPIESTEETNEERAVFGPGGFQVGHALDQLNEFAISAFRRPLVDTDRKRIASFYETRLSEDASARQAALDSLKMILCSPSFLYLAEITPEDDTKLGAYDLASRLSYALWTAPPDDELYQRAKSGDLTETKHLRNQVLRMLEDPRSDAFVVGFLDSWLNLRDIGNLPPPRKQAPNYYSENLPDSMKQEARLFFRHLIDRDGSVIDFLHSEETKVSGVKLRGAIRGGSFPPQIRLPHPHPGFVPLATPDERR